MLTIDRIIMFGWPGCGFDTDDGVITKWYDGNPLPQPTPEEIEARRAAAEDYWRRSRMVISAVQGRRQLSIMGKRGQAEQIVAGAGEEVQDFWEYETEWRRLSPLINRFAPLLGIVSEEEKDAFFDAAAQIKAA